MGGDGDLLLRDLRDVLGEGEISPSGAGLILIRPPGIIMPGAIISPGSAIEELKPGSGGRLGRPGRPVEEARLQLSAPDSDLTDFIDFIAPSSSPFSFSRESFLLSAIVNRLLRTLVSDCSSATFLSACLALTQHSCAFFSWSPTPAFRNLSRSSSSFFRECRDSRVVLSSSVTISSLLVVFSASRLTSPNLADWRPICFWSSASFLLKNSVRTSSFFSFSLNSRMTLSRSSLLRDDSSLCLSRSDITSESLLLTCAIWPSRDSFSDNI